MSIQSILNNKHGEIDQLLEKFNKVYSAMQPKVFNLVKSLFRSGVYDETMIKNAFIESGFQDLYLGFVDEFTNLIKFGKELSRELGFPFKLTDTNYQLLDIYLVQIESNFSASLSKYANDLADSGLRARMGGQSFGLIVQNLKDQFAGSGRRFETEAYTGITQFDSALNFQLFDEAGIEKFVYVGAWDDKTRDACIQTLSDPRQGTGWTMDEINSSGTPFTERGGYNCRHEWLPYVSDLKPPQNPEG